MKASLPLIVMEKILKKSGAKRISESAKEELRNILENKGKQLSEKAIVFAKHAKRKTVQKADISVAIKP